MNWLKKIFNIFIPVTLTKEQLQDIEYVKKTLLTELHKLVFIALKVRDKIHKDAPEIMIAVIHLKFFGDHLQKRKFRNIEDAWDFMNNLKGIVDKMSYVNNYLKRVTLSSAPTSGKPKDQESPDKPVATPPKADSIEIAVEQSKENG